ncbi:phage holin family protein [Paenibacillus thiaminolyticus]|uniref:phage holin family protein n=1 Tax=Paenibacillus thiaminolyticus TaxID=49283 RepID=UPI0035A66404
MGRRYGVYRDVGIIARRLGSAINIFVGPHGRGLHQIQPGSLLFRTIAIFFYAGREGLSVVENLGVYGVDLPPKLVAFLEQLNEKGKEEDDHDHRN